MPVVQPASSDPPFTRVAIAGLGLIGGSIALGTRVAWPGVTLVGFDQSADVAQAARRSVVHETVGDVAALADADVIVVATPLAAAIDLLPAIARLESRAIVTDVGSTKRDVMAAATAAGLSRFIGGHPMAGSERTGIGFARADLFEGRPWLLVRGGAGPGAEGRVETFVRGLGALPQWIDASTHDRTIAYVSHLPQLAAVALMNAASQAVGGAGLGAAGRAFHEMTRLASSPPDMWQAIFSRNADFIAEAVARFVSNLPTDANLTDAEWVRDAFARAAAARARANETDVAKR